MLLGAGNGAYEPPEIDDSNDEDLDLWLVACKFLNLFGNGRLL